MNKSNVKVEQIINNEVINDYGEILSKKELYEIITDYFPNSYVNIDGTIRGKYLNNEYSIFIKNVSYLGIPHPFFKKRIQIPKEFGKIYNDNLKNRIKTILLGVYKYKDEILFCSFNPEKYVTRKMHNSSAHVYTIDLLNGSRFGLFRKTDHRGNEITVFDKYNIDNFLKGEIHDVNVSNVEVFDVLDDFFDSIYKEWNGIECYAEMIENNFKNKYQPEWPGFYLEYLLENYLDKNSKKDTITFLQDKTKNGIDLDLYFPKLETYGDLKAHSSSSSAIQGNDYKIVENILKDKTIYYIVCNHDTNKDKNYDYEVTKYWNNKQNKTNILSYGEKMKHDVLLKGFYILEINKYNKKYLKIFNQGKNSDGSKRNPKIMIENKNLSNFIVHVVNFENSD